VNCYVDTSALAKRYITEVGSNWVRGITARSAGNVIAICELTPVEFFSSLTKRARTGTLMPASILILQTGFLAHYTREYVSVLLEGRVMTNTRVLVNKYPLRTLDAIQLSSALEFANVFNEPVVFISADTNLLTAAAAEGFTTDNPLLHP
jgi:uncharacterized protein